jgi:rod shape-determining protein MreC
MGKSVIVIAIIVILVLLQNILGILNPINNFLIKKTEFINSFFYTSAINLKNIYENYKNLHQINQENQKLKQEVETLTAQISNLQFLEQENKSLKENLNFLKEKKYKFVSGRVFIKNFDSVNRILMVDKGSDDGVKKDMPVIGEGGVLIGVIEKAEPSYSLIKLLSDNSSEVSVMIQNASKSLGLLRGNYNLGMRIELIPQDEQVEKDNLVVSSGLDKNIPPGLLVGYVENVKNNSLEPFQTAFIKPAVNYNKTTVVTIILYD